MSGLFASRRAVVKGAAVVGAAALGAAACGPRSVRPGATPTAPVDLGAPDAVAVGSVKLFRDDRVVVFRAAGDEYRAFSAVCTHGGCVLANLHRTTGECTCHGSRFDVTTGAVLRGPASEPLPPVPIRNAGGRLVAGPEKPTGSASPTA